MRKRMALGLILAVALLLIYPAFQTISAANPAYLTRFTTSLTYQNIDTQPAKILIQMHDSALQSPEVTVTPRPTLAPLAGSSINMGYLLYDGYRGSAILLSNRKLAITMVQIPDSSNTEVKVRLLSNATNTSSSKVLIPSVLSNQYSTTSVFSIQNADMYPNTVDIDIYNSSGSIENGYSITAVIQPGNVFYYDAGIYIGTSFSGSAIVNAVREGTTTPGKIIGDIREYSITGYTATAYEGVNQGARTLSLPFAMCQTFGGYSTIYGVQNTSMTASTNVTIDYYANDGTKICSATSGVPKGTKVNFKTCDCGGTYGMNGSVKISSDATDIVAVGKVYNLGASNAAVAFSSANGHTRISLPYVRWSEAYYKNEDPFGELRQRCYIATQNIGTTDIPAGAITVRYYNKYGFEVVTHTINAILKVNQKTNSNAYITADPDGAEFGYYPDRMYGGSTIVECTAPSNCKIVAIARCNSYKSETNYPSEDYNSILVP